MQNIKRGNELKLDLELENICNKYPFIYEINGDYYVIGKFVFKPYNDLNGLEDYKKYREVLSKIGRENIGRNYALDKAWENELVDCFQNVMEHANEICKRQRESDIIDILLKFKEEEKHSLKIQMEDYINSFWHYNRRISP